MTGTVTAERDERHLRAERLRNDGHSQVETADEVGVTVRTIKRWESSGKVRVTPDNAAVSLSDVRMRKEQALAEKYEIQAAKMRGELVPKSEWHGSLIEIRRALESAPRLVAMKYAAESGMDESEALILAERLAELVHDVVLRQLERWSEDDMEVQAG